MIILVLFVVVVVVSEVCMILLDCVCGMLVMIIIVDGCVIGLDFC